MDLQTLLYFAENWKLLLFLLSIYGFYYYATYTFDFFKKKGISYIKPRVFGGSVWKRVTKELTSNEFQLYIYDYFKGKPYGGVFEGRQPNLYIFDPDLIKAIAIRDFEHFCDRNSLNSNEPRFLKRSLNKLKGSEWKIVRNVITPSFSSARLKNMMPLIQQSSDQMVKFLEQYDKSDIDIKDLVSHLTLEVIGACAFGITTDALSDENSRFIELARQLGYISLSKKLVLLFFMMLFPNLIKYINVSFANSDAVGELVKVLSVTKAERRKAESKKKDFLQLMVDASKKEKEEVKNTNSVIHFDDDTIDAQSFLFVLGGYDTTSTMLSYGIHTLAIYPDIQDKLREHILEVTNGREITYDLMLELTYLDGFLLETLRMNPPFGKVERTCTKEYILPGTNIKIDVGDVISIPVYGIHMDPDIYPEPYEFRPERFMGDEKKNRPSHLFLAFGAGARNCIGMRFALLAGKIAMISMLKNYKFSTCVKTENPIKADMESMTLKPASGIWVKIEKI